MDATETPRAPLASALTRLAALWILTGALFKLLAGDPMDLPPMVRAFFLGPGLTFRLAIAIELSIVLLALLRPRVGWILVALQLLVFLGVLVPLIASGAESCGCLGKRVVISPGVMFAIDATLLVALLASRPWRLGPPRASPALVLPVVLIAWATPFLMLGFSDPKLVPPPANGDGAVGWSLPAKLPGYAQLDPAGWVGKPIAETELAALMDVRAYPGDADWILYSVTCDHCGEYLRELGAAFPEDPKLYVFVRLTQEDEETYRQVQAELMPPGEEAKLPAGINYDVTPPWHLRLVDGVVVDATQPER